MRGIRKILPTLAPMFNFLLGIDEGFFGSTPRKSEPSPANKRAARDLAAHRATFEYTKAFPAKVTRQQRRRADLLAAKRERQAESARLRKMTLKQRREVAA